MAASTAQSSSEYLCCPCDMKTNGVRANSVTITCFKCSVKWHTKCIGLNGMSSKESTKYTEWSCPCCFILPTSDDSSSDSKSLQEQIKAEVMNVLPLLVTTVVKQTEKTANCAYASVTKESQESFVKKCTEESSTIAVEKGLRRIEGDIAGKDRRKRNIIIRNVSECVKDPHLKKSDRKIVESILADSDSDSSNEIISVVRLEVGRIKMVTSKPSLDRCLL